MKNFYATWDLMEICTLINLVAMASEESKHKIEEAVGYHGGAKSEEDSR